jgi:hypothetical protein
VRRLLLPFCIATLTVGIAAFAQITPEAAVAVRGPSNPFPPVWTAQAASEVASQASAVTDALRQREAVERWTAVATWNAAVAANARALRSSSARGGPAARTPARPPARSEPGTGRCGGNLPPCSVMTCESGGDLLAVNRHNPLRPAGKWQIITPTWNGYGGYATADQAPESVQDERAAQIYNGGAGRGQWAC